MANIIENCMNISQSVISKLKHKIALSEIQTWRRCAQINDIRFSEYICIIASVDCQGKYTGNMCIDNCLFWCIITVSEEFAI